MKILLKPNLQKPNAARCGVKVIAALREIAAKHGQPVTIFLDESDGAALAGCADIYGKYGELILSCDIVIPIGGDGTVMRVSQAAAKAGKPVLGVNAGRLGFLTQAEMDEISGLERLFTGEYTVQNRMMLEARISNNGEKSDHTALNDVVVRHGDADRIVTVAVKTQGRPVAAYRADGLIFSTPTGSTAYSLSAGGPVVPPEMELIVLTPICPHAAFNCPVILPAQGVYEVSEQPCGDSGMHVSLDGVRTGKLLPGGCITVKRSGIYAKFIDLGTRDFFSSLNQKLSWR